MKNGLHRPAGARRVSRELSTTIAIVLALVVVLLCLPVLLFLKQAYVPPAVAASQPFTVTVDPVNKTIVDDPDIEAHLSFPSPLGAAVASAGDVVDRIAYAVAETPLYSMLGASDAPQFVVIEPGFRKEEVANAFAKALKWNAADKKAFLALNASDTPPLPDGTFTPGFYMVGSSTTLEDAENMTDDRFAKLVLSRYSTTTADVIPLDETLTVASLIQRETGDREEMRMISGIIWNRIFAGMKLQIDATLQYAKTSAKKGAVTNWWPKVAPSDKYIKSAYNTYQNQGLPPAPISNPGISAIIAALNPKKTDCLFYFHDQKGDFHCSATYEEHVALLKEYFGQGK